MGSSYSLPIEDDPDLDLVGITFTRPNLMILIHAPDDVLQMVLRITGNPSYKSKFGTTEIALKYDCFFSTMGRNDATYGKLMCVRLLAEMHKMGYDMVTSSDMARKGDNSTLLFARRSSPAESAESKVVCVAPGQRDMLVLLPAEDQVVDTVRDAIQETWPKGIDSEFKSEEFGQKMFQFKLNGYPWVITDYVAVDQNVQTREMLMSIIGKLGACKYKFMGGVNIKGGTDAFFFIYDANYRAVTSDFGIISLNKKDRLRLVNCVEMSGPIKDVITTHYSAPQKEGEKHGSWELKLEGEPWYCEGIISRRLICRISETMLEHGWDFTNALDVSRSAMDKSVLLYTKQPPFKTSFACIGLLDRNRICLLDFPADTSVVLKAVVDAKYGPGAKGWSQRKDNCWETTLSKSPWLGSFYSGCSSVHARSLVMHLVKKAATFGWSLVASADVSARFIEGEPIDVHSLYFKHIPGLEGTLAQKAFVQKPIVQKSSEVDFAQKFSEQLF